MHYNQFFQSNAWLNQGSKIKRMKAAVLDSEFQTLKTGEGYIKLSGYNPAKFIARKPRVKDIAESYIENEKLAYLLVQEREEQEKYRIEVEKELNKKTVDKKSSSDQKKLNAIKDGEEVKQKSNDIYLGGLDNEL